MGSCRIGPACRERGRQGALAPAHNKGTMFLKFTQWLQESVPTKCRWRTANMSGSSLPLAEYRIMAIFFTLVGFISIIGTACNWRFIADPPERWAKYYSQAFLKKVFGRSFLRKWNYFIGGIFIAIAFWSFLKSISG